MHSAVPCNGSTVFSKAISPQRAILCFVFQFPLSSRFPKISSCIRLFPCLPVTFILPTIHPSITRLAKQFQRQMLRMQLVFFLFIECKIFPSISTLCSICHSSHDWSKWSSPFFFSITFQNFPGTSDLLFELSKLQHPTQLCHINIDVT